MFFNNRISSKDLTKTESLIVNLNQSGAFLVRGTVSPTGKTKEYVKKLNAQVKKLEKHRETYQKSKKNGHISTLLGHFNSLLDGKTMDSTISYREERIAARRNERFDLRRLAFDPVNNPRYEAAENRISQEIYDLKHWRHSPVPINPPSKDKVIYGTELAIKRERNSLRNEIYDLKKGLRKPTGGGTIEDNIKIIEKQIEDLNNQLKKDHNPRSAQNKAINAPIIPSTRG
ncbi:hypothetical protein PYE51_03490 [Vibrio aestuarianus]|uniref:Uncharacterized protein n=1 Tax=Vibrio aestuarianus TaxID=28171 RepID=A0AAX3U4D5_9VIBR|nr:hypothetical protein [Vibrio aestuarianus]WGK82323.1 hypothetical protein PYE51_03490 [Vibrio aestuarianus]